MSLFIEFEGDYSSKYSLALHVAYHMEQYKVIAEHEGWAARAHVPEALLAEYEAVIALLRERNHEAHSDIKTERSGLEESERDRLLSMFFFILGSSLTAADEAVREAAKLLDTGLGHFKKIRYEADDAETALIRALLSACEEEQYQSAIDKLGLRALLPDLERANERFMEIKMQRMKERHERRLQLSTREARRKADELLGDIQRLISATGVIASVTPGAEETAAFIESLMHDMNAVIRSYRTAWRQSEGQKQARRKRPENEEEETAAGEENLTDK